MIDTTITQGTTKSKACQTNLGNQYLLTQEILEAPGPEKTLTDWKKKSH